MEQARAGKAVVKVGGAVKAGAWGSKTVAVDKAWALVQVRDSVYAKLMMPFLLLVMSLA
jgi:hypothetical protein